MRCVMSAFEKIPTLGAHVATNFNADWLVSIISSECPRPFADRSDRACLLGNTDRSDQADLGRSV